MYLKILVNILEIKYSAFLKDTMMKIIPSIIVQIIFILSIRGILPVSMDLTNFAIIILLAVINIGLGFGTLIIIAKEYRNSFYIYNKKLFQLYKDV